MSEDEAARAPQCLSFGPFRLYARERRLERDVEVIKVGSRSLDMIVLTERPGEIISNEELTARVWSDSEVEASGHVVVIGDVNVRYALSPKGGC
jgi:DNA-binding winged helix-turn-helix (wHTH) protein